MDDDERCELCGEPVDIDSVSDCVKCGMVGCSACVRTWDDVIGDLCRECEPRPQRVAVERGASDG